MCVTPMSSFVGTSKSRSRALCSGVVLTALVSFAPAYAENDVGTATVIEVTVYRSGAEVVREVMANVPRGTSTVTVSDFPKISSAEVQVSSGDAAVLVSSLTASTRKDEIEINREELQQQLETLGDRLFGLEAADTDQSAMRSLLIGTAKAMTCTKSECRKAETLDAASVEEMYGVMETRFQDLLTGQLARRKERRELEAAMEEIKSKLAKAAKPTTSHLAHLQVQAEQTTTVPIRFRYFVSQAEWEPRYRASLDDEGKVEMIAEAAVRQWTNEDWLGARLRLSTVSPSNLMSAPYLGTWQVMLAQLEERSTAAASLMDQINASGNQASQQPNFIGSSNVFDESSQDRGLDVESTRYSVTFDAMGRPNLPGDGTSRQVELWRQVVPATVYYRLKPSLTTDAYLEATLQVPDNMPLLAGKAHFYAGGTRLGEANLPETPPGADVILPFGIDQRVQVKRRTLDVSTGRRAFKSDGEAHSYRTTISNFVGEPIKLVLEERMPVSDDDRIEVSVEKSTTEGAKPSKTRRGVWLWTLDLQPEETRMVDFAFSVRYPREFRLFDIK